jgi:hypothetical protein
VTASPTRRAGLEEDGTLAYIEIDYEPRSEDPARVFRAMALLIDAFHEIDKDLLGAVSVTLEPVLILDRIEEGSIRAYLRTLLRHLDDDALKNLDWKPLVGQYLVKGKHALLQWLERQESTPTRSEVAELQTVLQELAPPPQSGQRLLPERIPAERIYRDTQRITAAVEVLSARDRVTYVSVEQTTSIDTSLQLSDEDIELALTDEVVTSETELILLVKKPDYLGNSRWEFRNGDKALDARMGDRAWLDRFQAGAITLHPGDSLRAKVRSELLRGFEGNVVGVRHEVLEVLQVVRQDEATQVELIEP